MQTMQAISQTLKPTATIKPPVFTGTFRSKKDAVLDGLRNAILQGDFKPGERLVIDELARQLGISPIPIREALQQLQGEGFVTIQPHVGATVTPIEASLVDEIFELLESLEIISSKAACRRMSKEDFARMEALLKEMDGLDKDLARWSEANVRLHEFISDCAGMPLVKSMLTKVLDHWKRLRQVYLHDVFARRVQDAQKEHWQMLRAMRACDTERLERIVRNHNRAAHAAYANHLKKSIELS